mmetsp:Transcript_10946/g.17286  ORF Transcript_10946/g.17286 Transcript_10946/m.17286 type:complete len:508 (-) Transcript_10946:85-1608(-)
MDGSSQLTRLDRGLRVVRVGCSRETDTGDGADGIETDGNVNARGYNITAKVTYIEANEDSRAGTKNGSGHGPLTSIIEFWQAIKQPQLKDDPSPEAVRLRSNLDLLRKASKAGNTKMADALTQTVFNATMSYFRIKIEKMSKDPRIRSGIPSLVNLANGIFILVFLRLALPRFLALEAADGDFSEFADFFGLPTKDQLKEYLVKIESVQPLVKLGVFQALWIFDKIFLLSELLPLPVILPAISPLLFGGILEGTIITSLCATVGASINFMVGKLFLREKISSISLFESPKLGDQRWFQRLNQKVQQRPFKSALLIRLAPLLPIPVDAHWYICGTTTMGLREFMVAYFIGTTKVAFIDASLGSLLLSQFVSDTQMQQQAKMILGTEVVLVVIISAVVTNIATKFVSDLIHDDSGDSFENATQTKLKPTPMGTATGADTELIDSGLENFDSGFGGSGEGSGSQGSSGSVGSGGSRGSNGSGGTTRGSNGSGGSSRSSGSDGSTGSGSDS